MSRNILRAQVCKTRKRGRPKVRWIDDVLEDLRNMDVRGYGEMVKDREYWRRLVLEAKAHIGL